MHSIQQEGQLDPILVRMLSGDTDYDYEIIYGVRRTFACSHIPNQPVTARVTNLDDKNCMILMHAENANSKSISEFERAFSFAQQMKSGHFNSQNEMAEIMGISRRTLSKMINAAEIFEVEWISGLFKTKLDITIKSAYTLSFLLKKAEARKQIKTEAALIQKSMAETQFLPSSQVLRRLIAAAKGTISAFASVVLSVNNLPVVYTKREKSGKFTIVIENTAKKLKASETESACLKALREHVLQALFFENNCDLVFSSKAKKLDNKLSFFIE